jgi:hypothetical protein
VQAESFKKEMKMTRFKGLVTIPQLRAWNPETFAKKLKKVLPPSFNEKTDLDIFGATDPETGKWRPTGTFTILFENGEKRTELEFGQEVYEVKEWIREPVRCYRCLEYGHTKQGCHNPEKCRNCGKPDHKTVSCPNKPACVQCDGEGHDSADRNCVMRRFFMNVEEYCNKYEVSQEEVLRFATEVTVACMKERDAAKTPEERTQVKLRWKKAFKSGSEKKREDLRGNQKKSAEKIKPIEIKKIVKKPAMTMNLLSSIFQRMGEPFKMWRNQTKMEAIQRSQSTSDLRQSRKKTNTPKYASQVNLNVWKKPATPVNEDGSSAMMRIVEARKAPNISCENLEKIIEIEEMQKITTSWEDRNNEMEIEDGVESSGLDEDEFPSLSSQTSGKVVKKKKNNGGDAKLKGQNKPENQATLLDCGFQLGKRSTSDRGG